MGGGLAQFVCLWDPTHRRRPVRGLDGVMRGNRGTGALWHLDVSPPSLFLWFPRSRCFPSSMGVGGGGCSLWLLALNSRGLWLMASMPAEGAHRGGGGASPLRHAFHWGDNFRTGGGGLFTPTTGPFTGTTGADVEGVERSGNQTSAELPLPLLLFAIATFCDNAP